ncbi:hypothetical protein EG028_03485 [Chitinophaga barathri]|uniref:BZIP transcription factor n=2 Tax=Chitinophaga barathri TaxID=1647451 RepID=A0A3N4MFQ7_9BACT|nr:hypothetical protein EG028_03485 [Chitinophaga barathri]
MLLPVCSFLAGHAQNNYPATGNVGWGTSSPQYRLDIRDTSSAVYSPGIAGTPIPAGTAVHISNIRTVNSKGAFLHLVSVGSVGASQAAYIGAISNPGVVYTPEFVIGHRMNADTYTERLRITAAGNVGIGVTSPAYKLAVDGTIGARRVKVTQETWADFVFHAGYQLPSLYEWETYIRENGHLPEIPNEEEVRENGLDLGEMNKKLLQKVEELTLHLINQQKLNDLQTKRIEQLEKKIDSLR